MINKKVNNLFYTGQLTVPGPGVPPSLISGEVVANYISKKIPLTQKENYDALAWSLWWANQHNDGEAVQHVI